MHKACISLGCNSSRQNANGILQNVWKRSRWFSISSLESQDVIGVAPLNMFKKFVRQIFSQNSRIVVAVVSNRSRTLLNLVSASQKARQMRDNFVRDWRPMKLNCDWLEKKMIICPGTPESFVIISQFVLNDVRHTQMWDIRETYAKINSVWFQVKIIAILSQFCVSN